MKQAFNNMDIYLGAMVGVNVKIVDVRVWVLIPNIINTNFKRGGGWDVEHRWFRSLPEWNWADHGVEPLVQAASPEAGGEYLPTLITPEPVSLKNSGGNTQTITVNATAEETPYILLAFDNSIAEEEIRGILSVERQGENDPIRINWVSGSGQTDPDAPIIAASDIIKNKVDEKEYRVVMLRLPDGGTYEANTGSLELKKHQETAVTPFEELDLTLNGSLSGQIKYAETGTKYVLRTYLGTEKGGADYLIDEREVNDSESISVNIPTDGTLAPTGNYYVTSFLMTEKTFDMEDGTAKTALVGIDSQQFTEQVSYTNTNQLEAPAGVSLTFTGNEVMCAEWQPVADADGYAVTIYQEQNGAWVDTGFGYDLKNSEDGQPVTSIDMALTVGGNAVSVNENSATSVPAENLSANQTYKVGVRAYRLVPTGIEEENATAEGEDARNPNKAFQGAKYYSAEAESTGEYLAEYRPLNMTLSVNGSPITADENGVYHAYVGGKQSNMLAVNCAAAGVTYQVTRMDRNTDNEILPDAFGEYAIPDFTGTLMLKIDGMQGNDVTSAFLLVSMDKTPPMLTLSDPIFYADTDSGEYAITGTADAGSQILYRDDDGDKSVYAAGDGSFTINGMLDERETSVSLYLRAQDSAGNLSKQQLALVARQAAKHSVTIKTDGNGTASASPATAAAGTEITLTATPNEGYHFKEWQVMDGGVTIVNDKFTMPDGNVEVKAIFEKDAPSTPTEFTVVFDGNGGTPSVGSMTTTNRKLSSLPSASRSKHSFDGWYTEKSGGTKVTTDTVFSANTTVYARWTYTGVFVDVATGSYYEDAVDWAVENGITKGTDDTRFSPDGICTRAQAVTFLWRAAGSPEPETRTMPFTDVPVGSYYYDAVLWAVENGITKGTSDTTFSPNMTCTRAQIVTFLWRSEKSPAAGTANPFADVKPTVYYADAVLWAVKNNITKGTTNTTFSPNADCTRAQIVTFLWRCKK